MDLREFIENAVLLQAGATIGTKRLNAFYATAGKMGINLLRPGTFAEPAAAVAESAGPGLTRRALGTLARRSPYIAAGAIGLDAIRGTPGLVEDVVEQWEGSAESVGIPKKLVKRKVSKFNKAISAGMKAVKKSKSFGKPGNISNSKKAFATVTKTVSGLNKGRKAPKKGIRGTIARAAKRIL